VLTSRTKTECNLSEYFQFVQFVDACTDCQKQLLHDRLILTPELNASSDV